MVVASRLKDVWQTGGLGSNKERRLPDISLTSLNQRDELDLPDF